MACVALLLASLGLARVRVGELKARALRFGVDTSSLFDKSELVAALESRAPGLAAVGAGHAVPLLPLGAATGAMGAGVSVDSGKTFWGIKLELPELAAPASAADVLFVLDSAATHSLLSQQAADILGARPTGALATASTASSQSIQGGFAQVCSLTCRDHLDGERLRSPQEYLAPFGPCGAQAD
eukprot:scaffold71065_cov33-Tisochrysis_lutea.AAC.3